jgi:hypothetical protein
MRASTIFSSTTQIEIEGSNVIQLVDIQPDHLVYHVAGFDASPITLFDYRPTELKALQGFLDSDYDHNFVEQFNTPAQINVRLGAGSAMEITFHEPNNLAPLHILWIVTGMRRPVHTNEYLFHFSAPLPDNRQILLACSGVTKTSLLRSSFMPQEAGAGIQTSVYSGHGSVIGVR